MPDDRSSDSFRVPRWVDLAGGFVHRHRPMWVSLGNLETRLLADRIDDVRVDRPIYVAGLARAGSTLLLECLASDPDVATHRYQDYPFLFTPYLWNRFLARAARRATAPTERTHGDGIAVTPESPEAFEEILWMAFFPGLHESGSSAVLDGRTHHPRFESFYRDHVRKLLRVQGRRRYASKANYNVTRLEYLLKLFPDARFVVPVRDPVWHVASLMKQHALFCRGQRRRPRALEHLRRVGHFELGLDRRAINAGDRAAVGAIEAA